MVKNQEEIISVIKNSREAISKLGINKVGVFGSFNRGDQRLDSDIDLLVFFNPKMKTFRNLIGFSSLAEEILGRKVDVLTPESLSPYIAPYVKKEIEYVQTT